MAGHTLADLIPPDGMDPARAIQLGAQIADALATAHQSGIVHRDLKPSNIMVNAQGRVKVLDFGLAKLIEPSGVGAATRTAATQTGEGAILGTVSYMAPEQAEGKPVDQRADIFSFGAVLYEMLSGVQPFRRDSVSGTLAAILRDEPPALDAARIPAALRQVIGGGRSGRALRPGMHPAWNWCLRSRPTPFRCHVWARRTCGGSLRARRRSSSWLRAPDPV